MSDVIYEVGSLSRILYLRNFRFLGFSICNANTDIFTSLIRISLWPSQEIWRLLNQKNNPFSLALGSMDVYLVIHMKFNY